jgi:predicted enzyme related to lactoylglutathione lyase
METRAVRRSPAHFTLVRFEILLTARDGRVFDELAEELSAWRAPLTPGVIRAAQDAMRTLRRRKRPRRYVPDMERSPLSLVEFPADEPERALRFWGGLLGVEMGDRVEGEGEGWQSRGSAPAIGVHARGPGPGDTVSLPYFEVDDLADALRRVEALGGSVIHPGERWAVCRDSEGSPFGLAARPR